MNKYIKYLVIVIVHLSFFSLAGQSKQALEEKRAKNLNDIKYTNQLLSKVKRGKKANIQKVLILNKRIGLRKTRINSIMDEIDYLNDKIEEKKNINQLMQEDLNNIKRNYANIIRHARRSSNNYQKWQFILSANNFNQAFKRMKYLQQYTDYRKKQAFLITALQDVIDENIIDLNNQIAEKKNLFQQKRKEIANLENEENEVKQEIKQLKDREGQLKQELKDKKEIALKLEREIQRIIEEERKTADNKFRKLTPEEKITNSNFEKNMGRLPWPTERGIITTYHGRQKHPVLAGVYIVNNGIEITTVEGSIVRAVFSGVVSKVLAIKGANFTVIIRHGNYLSVYQNLVDVMVKSGDKIDIKEPIGRVFTDKNHNSILHFEIWNEVKNLDPVNWITGS